MNNTIPAVDKTIQMLELLSECGASQSELSRRLQISMSTAYRILQTLLSRKWVQKDENGIYTLSAGLLTLFPAFDSDLAIITHARRKVDEIVLHHHIACKLSLRRGREQVTDYRAEPPGPVSLTGHAGSRFPLIEGSVGGALLADETDSVIEELLKTCSVTIPEKENPSLLWDAVNTVRTENCVLNVRKNRWNIAAFSAPLRNNSGRIFAALTLIGTADDFTIPKRQKWQEILLAAAAECENISKTQFFSERKSIYEN